MNEWLSYISDKHFPPFPIAFCCVSALVRNSQNRYSNIKACLHTNTPIVPHIFTHTHQVARQCNKEHKHTPYT